MLDMMEMDGTLSHSVIRYSLFVIVHFPVIQISVLLVAITAMASADVYRGLICEKKSDDINTSVFSQ